MCPSCFLLAFSVWGWSGAPPACSLVGGGRRALPLSRPARPLAARRARRPPKLLFTCLRMGYGHHDDTVRSALLQVAVAPYNKA